MNSKNPKAICTIIATISLLVLWSLMPGFWIAWELIGAVLVAIGCIGEWYLIKRQREGHESEKHGDREMRFVTAVAIGVTMELIGLAHAIPEAMRLEKEVETLRKQNLELYAQIQPRRINAEQKLKIVEALRAIRGKTCRIGIVFNEPDVEARLFALDIWQVLQICDFPTVEIHEQFVTFPDPLDVTTGVTLEASNPMPPEAKKVIALFVSAGLFPTNRLVSPIPEKNLLKISVWSKPLN